MILSALPSALSALQQPWWTSPQAPLLPTAMLSAPSLTKDKGHPTTFRCRLPPLLIVKFPLAAGDCRCRRFCRHHRRAVALPAPPLLPTLRHCRRCHQAATAALPLSCCRQRRSQAAAAANAAAKLLPSPPPPLLCRTAAMAKLPLPCRLHQAATTASHNRRRQATTSILPPLLPSPRFLDTTKQPLLPLVALLPMRCCTAVTTAVVMLPLPPSC